MCTKVCESGAITVNGAIASIDYEKCTHCGKCVEKCPRKIIVFEEGKAKIEEPETEESETEESRVEEPINEVSAAVTPTSDEPTPAVITEEVKTEETDTPTAPDSAENQAEETTPDSQTTENP